MTTQSNGLGMGLHSISRLSHAMTRSISAENPTGEKGRGAMATEGTGASAARDLGRGWKVSPSMMVAPGTITCAGRLIHPRVMWAQITRSKVSPLLPSSLRQGMMRGRARYEYIHRTGIIMHYHCDTYVVPILSSSWSSCVSDGRGRSALFSPVRGR